jgi:hypothetical protein
MLIQDVEPDAIVAFMTAGLSVSGIVGLLGETGVFGSPVTVIIERPRPADDSGRRLRQSLNAQTRRAPSVLGEHNSA